MSEQCAVYRLGLVPYEEVWQLQGRLATQIAGGAQLHWGMDKDRGAVATF
jgi:hypothetical protein